jgi:hypothetical protein
MRLLLFFSVSLLCLFSCGGEASDSDSGNGTDQDTTSTLTIIKEQPLSFTVALDYLRLRDAPGEKGTEVGMLNEGDIVEETGEVSDFTTRIQLRGVWYDEPWVKVRTTDGKEGWVFAGGLTFDPNATNALSERLLELRLKSFFGPSLVKRIQNYRTGYNTAQTSESFASLYREGELLRDTMASILEQKIDVSSMDYEKLPDLFWVEEGLPGYETALVAEGTIYYLFQDYKQLQKLSQRTSGKEDDDYISLMLQVHSVDSVEYFFPAWYLQTWDYGGHSLLGQGKHIQILKLADQNLKRSPMFLDETLRIKDQVIEDITRKNNTYWESKSKIMEELDAIQVADLSILTNEDKIALETRKKQFENPSANNITINQRTGK